MKFLKIATAALLCSTMCCQNYIILANEEKPIYEDVHDEETCKTVDGDWNEERGVCEVKTEETPVEVVEDPVPEIIEEPVVEIVEDVKEDNTEEVEDNHTDNKGTPDEPSKEEPVHKEDKKEKEESKPVVRKYSKATPEQIARYKKPDFTNQEAYGSKNPYTKSWLGQCTWYAWGRFVEVYGYDPGFTGVGSVCVDQLVSKHPDLWEYTDKPVVGAMFSGDSKHNHIGMIVGIEGNLYIVQEGNLNGRNDTYDEIETDWWTQTYTMDEFESCYGKVTFANPKKGVDESKLLVQPTKKEKKEIKPVLNNQLSRVLVLKKIHCR